MTPPPKRPRRYKLVNSFTKDMGSGGGQIRLGYVDKLDAQGITGYLHNLQISAIINNYDGGDTTPGIMFFLTSDDSFDSDTIIDAAAVPIAGKVSLSAKRNIYQDADQVKGNTGRVHLYAELTDITITDNIEARFVVATWGNFVEFTEV